MWDAELPMLKKSLMFSQLINYSKNKKLILNFFKNSKKYNIEIITSEYPLESKFFRSLLHNLFLISFDPNKYNNEKNVQLYSSFLKKHPNIVRYLEKQIRIGKKLFGNKFIVGLGCIATGILGNEPVLTSKELERDLKIVKELGINEIIIFRLGGLNKEYLKAIKAYAK